MNFVNWLLYGNQDLYLPQSWLSNKSRMRQYVGYTMRQLQQGSVTKDSEWFRRQAFWQAVEAKRRPVVPVLRRVS